MMRHAPFAGLVAFTQLAYAFETCNLNVSQPQNNAPLDLSLAYYRLGGYNGDGNQLTHTFVQTDCGANLSINYSQPSAWDGLAGTAEKPILLLTHGYPESSYICSACCNADGCAYDKRTYAKALLQAVRKLYGDSHVIYAGHDRGARTMHRAAVDNNFPGTTGLGFFAADIVPFIDEYASFANPFWSQNYFHWAFLPKGNFAINVIMAYGAGDWVHQIFEYGSGLNEAGIAKFKAGNAWEIYENFYNQVSVTNASTFDYQAGATIDYDMQLWDQGNGTKIQIPTHVLYSIYNLASAFDVEAVWANYTDTSAGLTTKGIGGQKGHFIIEEAPDDTIKQLNTFLDRLGVGKSVKGG